MASQTITVSGWTSLGSAAALVESLSTGGVWIVEAATPPASTVVSGSLYLAGGATQLFQPSATLWALPGAGAAMAVVGVDPQNIASGGGGGGGSNASVGSTGAAVPSSATALGFQNASGNLVLPTPSSGLPVAVAGVALDATCQAILTALQAQRAETIWTDDSGAFFVRIDNGGSISWLTISGGASSAPGTGARPAAGVNVLLDATRYQATVAGSGFAIGDYLSHVVTADPSSGAVIANFWLNVTQNTRLSSAPSSSNITPISPLPANAALETGGNLASIAANVSTAANQTTANTSLASILSKLSGVLSVSWSGQSVGVGNKPVGPAALATSQASISTSASLIVAARTGAVGTGRVAVTLYNSGATTVYFGPSGVTTATGAILPAGAAVTLDTTAAVYGVTSSGTDIVGVTETF